MKLRALLWAGCAMALPASVDAQALRCSAPAGALRVRPELPTAEQPRRIVPVGGYTLAVTWAPQYCHEHARGPGARFQCGGGNRFGFTLHGLWPDGIGPEWPQYCRSTGLLPQPLLRRNLCATPSAQLLQHEWAKHGTCMAGTNATDYFARSTGLHARLRYPDMDALSRRRLDAGMLARAVAAANPGMDAGMMRITANRSGWLDEIWFCLDRTFRYARCPAHQGGIASGTAVRIWRAAR